MSDITEQQRREYKKIFDQFDVDDNGCIDWDEFRKLVNELGEDLTLEDKLAAFHDADSNRSGRIDFEEFIDWWSQREK